MNHLVFNNKQYPLNVISNSIMAAARLGNAYVTTANMQVTLTASGGGAALMLTNPSGTSNKRIMIESISLTVLEGVIPMVEIIRAGVLTGTVDMAVTTNTNIGSANLTSANNQYVINPAGDPITDIAFNNTMETAVQIASVFKSTLTGGAVIIPPGNSISVMMTGTAIGQSFNVAAEMAYWEEPL